MLASSLIWFSTRVFCFSFISTKSLAAILDSLFFKVYKVLVLENILFSWLKFKIHVQISVHAFYKVTFYKTIWHTKKNCRKGNSVASYLLINLVLQIQKPLALSNTGKKNSLSLGFHVIRSQKVELKSL